MANTHGYPNAESHDRLRRSARDLIEHGVAPCNHGGNISAEALQLLYERASKPESAADALKLLHELQTYQVELDLLYEQIQANEYEVNEELAHYKSLYEQAPAAYLIMANDGEIIEGNQAAGALFRNSDMALKGIALSLFLAPGQRDTVTTLLQNAREHVDGARGLLKLPDHRALSVNARPAATRDSILMILTEMPAHDETI